MIVPIVRGLRLVRKMFIIEQHTDSYFYDVIGYLSDPHSCTTAPIVILAQCCLFCCLAPWNLPASHSSVDDYILSGHVRTGVTGQKHTRSPEILWFGNSVQHDFVSPTLQQIGELGRSAAVFILYPRYKILTVVVISVRT